METEFVNNLKNIFTGVAAYQILVDILIPVATFIFGIFLEHKYHISNTITQKINLKFKQSGKSNIQNISKQESGRDSINAPSSTSIKGPLIGPQYVAMPNTAEAEDALKPPEPLPDTQYHGTNTDYIIDCFEKHSKKLKPTNTFKDDLVKVHKDLNMYKNADVSSAQYFNVFKDVKENLTNKKMYCGGQGVEVAIAKVSNTFGMLEEFVSKPNKQVSELSSLIVTFEQNVVTLFAYII